jgi:hypothetical protein
MSRSHTDESELRLLLSRLQSLDIVHDKNPTLDLNWRESPWIFKDWITGNFSRKWHTEIGDKCQVILKTCGQQGLTNDLLTFANFCYWTANDTTTKYTGFRHFSNVYHVKDLWRRVEPQLRAYQKTLSETSANFKNIEPVLTEMDRYMHHYVNEGYTWN